MCESSLPAGAEFVGCFEDSSAAPLLNSDCYVLSDLGEDGMTGQVIKHAVLHRSHIFGGEVLEVSVG